jgi:cytochrome P450
MQSQTTNVPGPSPDHIPPNLVRDVDFFALACPGEDPQHGWWRMQQANPDIFWTPRNGGHWVVTRADLIEQILNDHERFSNREIMIPRQENLFANLLYTDPPDHAPLRKVIMPALTKTALEKLEDEARQAATTALDELVPRGGCEFFSEFAQVLPIVVFLDMMGLPLDDRHKLLPLVETVVLGNDVAKRMDARMQLAGYVQVWIDRRVAQPGTDVISRIAHSNVGDRPITPEEISNMCVLLLFGGLDTVAAMISFIARDLALRPELRKRLIKEPEIMPAAIEEFLRRHGLVNAAREVTHDFDFEGLKFKTGDLVQVPNCLHGLDDRRHADPLTIDFDRPTPIRHASFGSGVHICPGGILARREIKVFLEEWLRRIPDFAIKEGSVPLTASGMVNGVKELHLVWDVPA